MEEILEEVITPIEENEPTPSYTINVGDYEQDGTVYENRCLSASFGGEGVASEVIPWEGTNNNPWDYKYEDNTFVLDILPMPTPSIEEPTQLDRIESQVLFTALMTDTLLEV